MSERFNEKPTVIQTSSNSGVWGAVTIVALLLAGGAMYYVSSNGVGGSDTTNITVDVPKVDVPAAPAAPTEAPAAAPAPAPQPAAPAAPATNQ